MIFHQYPRHWGYRTRKIKFAPGCIQNLSKDTHVKVVPAQCALILTAHIRCYGITERKEFILPELWEGFPEEVPFELSLER